MNDNFRQILSTIVEDRILNHDANNRDSNNASKKPILNKTNSSSEYKNNTGYLQPINENPSETRDYLKPSNKPVKGNQGTYLEPEQKHSEYIEADKKPTKDTYTGGSFTPRYYPDTYIGPTPQPSYINGQPSSRYMNEEIINELKAKNLVQNEQSDDDGYLMPRQNSTMSTSSTAPLIIKKLNSIGSRPAKTASKKSAHYIPPKMLNNHTLTCANDYNETDV